MIRHGLAICDETIRDPCGFVDLSFLHRVLMFHKWFCSIHWWFNGDLMVIYPLVNVNKKLWKNPPCYEWENQLFLWAFSIAMLVIVFTWQICMPHTLGRTTHSSTNMFVVHCRLNTHEGPLRSMLSPWSSAMATVRFWLRSKSPRPHDMYRTGQLRRQPACWTKTLPPSLGLRDERLGRCSSNVPLEPMRPARWLFF